MVAFLILSAFLLIAVISGKGGCHPFDKVAVLPLRGVLALSVVVGHLSNRVGFPENFIGKSAVAIFFFLSGYGLMKKRISCSDQKVLRGGFVKAIIKLLPTFLIASCIYAAWEISMGHQVPLWANICRGSSELPIPFTWYVPAVLALYGIFYVANRLCKTNGRLVLCICAGVIGYWILTAVVLRWPVFWWKTIGGFAAGVIFAEREQFVRQLIAKRPRMDYGVAFLLLLSVYAATRADIFSVRFAAEHLYFALLGPIVALILFRFALVSKVFDFLGGYSYEIYIVHGAFVCGLLNSFSSRILYCGVVFLCAILAAVLLRKIRELLDELCQWISRYLRWRAG